MTIADRYGECDSCHSTDVKLHLYKGHAPGQEDYWFCDVCASTPAGNATRYPRVYEHPDVLRSLSVTTNKVLKKLQAVQEEVEDLRKSIEQKKGD